MIFKRKINTAYVSEIDTFLKAFDEQHPEKSDTQKREIEKHERIFKKRDYIQPEEEKSALWEEF